MNAESIAQTFWICVLGCILFRVVKATLILLATTKWMDAFGYPQSMKLISGTSTMPPNDLENEPRFWHKSTGISENGMQRTWEGGFNAASLQGALDYVRQISLCWHAREVHKITCFKVDHNGVIEDAPSIWQTFEAGRALITHTGTVQNTYEEQPLVEAKPDAATLYESADWMKETEIPARFHTVRLKEQ